MRTDLGGETWKLNLLSIPGWAEANGIYKRIPFSAANFFILVFDNTKKVSNFEKEKK